MRPLFGLLCKWIVIMIIGGGIHATLYMFGHTIEFEQPDRSLVPVKVYGNPPVFFTSTDDYLLMQNSKKVWVYAMLDQEKKVLQESTLIYSGMNLSFIKKRWMHLWYPWLRPVENPKILYQQLRRKKQIPHRY